MGIKEPSDRSNYKAYFLECDLFSTDHCPSVHCCNCQKKLPLTHASLLGRSWQYKYAVDVNYSMHYHKALRYYNDKHSVRAHIKKNNRTTHIARVCQSWNKLKAEAASKR